MCEKNKTAHLEEIAKKHGMSVKDFQEKIGLKINPDGSHSFNDHTMEMLSKEYSDEELTELAKQHNLTLAEMKEHIEIIKNHH